MVSKKVLKGKLATLPRKNDLTKEFRKDWQGLQHKGINLASLKEAMTLRPRPKCGECLCRWSRNRVPRRNAARARLGIEVGQQGEGDLENVAHEAGILAESVFDNRMTDQVLFIENTRVIVV